MNWFDAVKTQIETAHHDGGLMPMETKIHHIPEYGIDYVVRQIKGLADKPPSKGEQTTDPFAPPYEPSLVVGDLAPAHVGLLNKFPVLDKHLLIVTREFEPQTGILHATDFEALLWVLADWNGLAFYNGGPEAGASQPHRHLQIVDLQLAPQSPHLPMADALAATVFDGDIGHSPVLDFPHAVARMPANALVEPRAGSLSVEIIYHKLLDGIRRLPNGRTQCEAYNLLVTRDWLWAVPRRTSRVETIEINALGFAGGLLVANDQQLTRLTSIGPTQCLTAVCGF